jgi:hypothetical protein
MSMSVSALLTEKYSIDIKPGGKGLCPFCRHRTFSIKRDDKIGKCFHPTCGRYVIPGLLEHSYQNGLDRVMEGIFQDFRASLLELAHADGRNAYTYLVHERRVHPQVVADSMLGAVPSDYDCASKFDPVISETESAVKAAQNESGSVNRKAVHAAEHGLEFLIGARDKFRNSTRRHAGWIAFFYTDAHHRIVAIRFREPYSKRMLYFKPYKAIAGLFGHGLFVQNQPEVHCSLDEFLITMEGEFNQLQLQSLARRQGEVKRQNTGYIFACSVGGVNNTDYEAIGKISSRPVFCYDNDSDGAGFIGR